MITDMQLARFGLRVIWMWDDLANHLLKQNGWTACLQKPKGKVKETRKGSAVMTGGFIETHGFYGPKRCETCLAYWNRALLVRSAKKVYAES